MRDIATTLIFVSASATVALGGTISSRTADLREFDIQRDMPNHLPGGVGNHGGVELALVATHHLAGALPSDGLNTFFATPGLSPLDPGTASWDFVWAVDTSDTGRPVGDFEITIQVGYQAAGGAPRQEIMVDLASMLASEAGGSLSPGNASSTRLTSLENLGFSRWSSLFGPSFSAAAPGAYDFVLNVSRSSDPSQSFNTTMSVIVVPLPAAVWAGIALLGAAGIGRSLRRL
jgi:hypothetical protein